MAAILAADGAVVFSKRAALRTRVRADDTCGNERTCRRRRKVRAVGHRRDAVRACEAGRERADAAQADGEADLDDRAIRRPQQRRRTLQAPREQIGMRRFAERAAKLAAEMRTRKP